jgi:hypothetical protein
MVPPNWEHPKKDDGRYQPLFNRNFKEAAAEWIKGLKEWDEGERQRVLKEYNEDYEYWEWAGDPPDRDYYMPEWDEEPTWFQVYETVSEGTPVTPPFATKEELIDYLVEHGDFWYQGDIAKGRFDTFRSKSTREDATAFVHGGYAPSFVVISDASGVTIKQDIECLSVKEQHVNE